MTTPAASENSPADESVTEWIVRLKGGDKRAARQIWNHFFQRLCAVARRKLGESARRARDEEDIALSAIYALCEGAKLDRFRQLEDRDDLWQLLVMITTRKATDAWRKARRTKEVGESAIDSPTEAMVAGMHQVAEQRHDAAFFDDMSVVCADLLGELDPKLRRVALLRLEGYQNTEIAASCGQSVKTVERRLRMIRERWAEHHFATDARGSGN